MDDLGAAFSEALELIGRLDPDVMEAALVSLRVSAAAILLAAAVGLPLGLLIGAGESRLKPAIVAGLNTLLALPTVLIGLVLFTLLCRRGLFGDWGLLYSSAAMVIGQFVLAVPIVAALTVAAVEGADARAKKTALTLGAGRVRLLWTLASEARLGLLAAVVAGFGRVIGEVGVSMMLGGNIRHFTRNLTTAIALETSKGEFARGIALGLILMALALGVNLLLQILRQRAERSWKSPIPAAD